MCFVAPFNICVSSKSLQKKKKGKNSPSTFNKSTLGVGRRTSPVMDTNPWRAFARWTIMGNELGTAAKPPLYRKARSNLRSCWCIVSYWGACSSESWIVIGTHTESSSPSMHASTEHSDHLHPNNQTHQLAMSGSDGAVLATLISPPGPIQDKSATADADNFLHLIHPVVDPMYVRLSYSCWVCSNPYPNIRDLIAGVTCRGSIRHSYCK